MGEVPEFLLPIDSEDDDQGGGGGGGGDGGGGDGNASPPRRARPSAVASALDRRNHRRHRRSPCFDCRHLDPGFVAVSSPPLPPSSFSFFRIGRGALPGSVSGSDCADLDDQEVVAVDPFDPSTPRRRAGVGLDSFGDDVCPLRFGAFDDVEEMGSDYHEVRRGFGLGFEVGNLQEGEGGVDGVDLEEGSDWDDACFVGRRSIALNSYGGDGEPPSSRGGEGLVSIVGFRSDSDSDAEAEGDIAGNPHSDDLNVPDRIEDLALPLCWDCLRIEEDTRDPNEDFDWEEVDGRVDERVQEESNGDLEIDGVEEEEETARNIEWEVLLTVNDLERNAAVEHERAESYPSEEHEGFVYTSEYEIFVGQLADQEFIKGNPPAAKSVAEGLPSVVLTQVDTANSNTLCAVCKDEISMEEKAKQLPCSHYYHADCILQWLSIRNTCPVCRHELPTDDPDYENWRAHRASSGGAVHESHVMYNFEIFHEE